MGRIKIAIADDQVLMLDGIKIILESEDDFEVIAVARDGKETIEKIKENKPDVVLLDIRMPVMNGVECTKLIKELYPEIVVLILTTFDDEEYIVDALRYGASGYLLKDITKDKLIQTIKEACKGELIMPSKVAVKLAQRVANQDSAAREIFDFNAREREIAVLLAQGFTNKQIATALSFSEGTVKNTVSSIYSKIDIYDRTTAALYLKEHGIK